MKSALRCVLTFLAAVAAFYFAYWIGGALLMMVGVASSRMLHSLSLLIAALAAFACGAVVWTSTAKRGLLRAVLLGAVVVGSVGFSAGFFGPILFMPHANQGPLLGLFITGPLGFIAGAVGGAIYWVVARQRSAATLP
jgi:hypothetical protein